VPWLTGRKIVEARRVDAPEGPKYANLDLAAGQRIAAVERRGKFLLLPLVGRTANEVPHANGDGQDILVIHLGMTGIVRASPPRGHERVRMQLDAGTDPVLYFQDVRRFGRFLVLPGGDLNLVPTLAAMGPEPITDDFTVDGFARALRRSDVAIKTYLLSQRPVAGVGNIYADEALWRSEVHPATPARRLARSRAKVVRLHTAIREVLLASIEAQGTTLNDYRTVNGEVGAYLEHLDAYGHEGAPCRRCGASLRKTVLAGRGTHYCPTCQVAPRTPVRTRSR